MNREPDPAWPDEELIRECRSGNQAAWNALVEKYKKLVYSMPARYGLPPQDAADIFQMVWTDLYRDLDRLEQAGAVRGWLATATARRCLLHKKRLSQTSEFSQQETPSAEDLSAVQLEAERDQIVREAVALLSPRCRRMIEMLFFEFPPRPYQEVAAELGLAGGSIGFIRGRCLAKLRDLLGEKGWK